MERPTTGRCAATLGDGSTCGEPFDVKAQGNIPKYCPTHRNQQLRGKLEREAKRRATAPPAVETARDEQELAESAASGSATDARICRASSCSIPLGADWLNEFCPAHWRILPVEVKGDLTGSRADEHLHDVAILRGLKAINRYEGRADYEAATRSS